MTLSEVATYRTFVAVLHSRHIAAHPELRATWLEVCVQRVWCALCGVRDRERGCARPPPTFDDAGGVPLTSTLDHLTQNP